MDPEGHESPRVRLISPDKLKELFRRGEALPDGRTLKKEPKLLAKDKVLAGKPRALVVKGQS